MKSLSVKQKTQIKPVQAYDLNLSLDEEAKLASAEMLKQDQRQGPLSIDLNNKKTKKQFIKPI